MVRLDQLCSHVVSVDGGSSISRAALSSSVKPSRDWDEWRNYHQRGILRSGKQISCRSNCTALLRYVACEIYFTRRSLSNKAATSLWRLQMHDVRPPRCWDWQQAISNKPRVAAMHGSSTNFLSVCVRIAQASPYTIIGSFCVYAHIDILIPPFAQTTCPVHHCASAVHNMPAIPAISLTYAGRPPAFSASSTRSLSSISSRILLPGVVWIYGLNPLLNSGVVPAHISVLTGPGLIAFTVARSASSLAQERVIASRAAFVPP